MKPPDDWDAIRYLNSEELWCLGCKRWTKPEDGKVLMLFPRQWYPHIPAGFEVEVISGRKEKFSPGATDDDHRFGHLAYGIRVRVKR